MYGSDKHLFYIFIITLYGGEKCFGSILRNDRQIDETYVPFEESNPGYSIDKISSEANTPLILDETYRSHKSYEAAENENEVGDTKTEAVKRVIRQARDVNSLYPRLPTTAPYQQQHYQNQNSYFNSQSNYTNPAYQQWRPTGSYNYSQSGYPTYTPNYDNGYQTPQYNPSGHQPPYNPQGSFNNYTPNDKYNNPNPSPGYPYRNPGLPGAQNVNPYNPPGYSQPNNYSGYPPHGNQGRSNFTYNPVPTSPYPTGNASNYQTPKYPFNNNYPNNFYSSTLPPTFNRTGYGPVHTNYPTNWTLYGRVTNTSNNRYPPKGPGYNRYQNHSSIIPYGINQHGVPNSNFNGTQQNWPNYPTSNNFNSNYPQNYPAQGPGSIPYNNNNQGVYPTQNQYGNNYYPNNSFNGTSTYRLAERYTPNIPSQPPRNGSTPNNQFYYPSVMNGTHQDSYKGFT